MRALRTAVLATALTATSLWAQEADDAARRTPEIPAQSCVGAGAVEEGAEPREAPPVLVEGLGHAGLEADSADPEARAWFAQGVRLIWAFDEAEAVRAFAEAQRRDGECALCFFGEAWARSPTINLRGRAEELPAARAAARRALALSEGLSERDRLLVRAMTIRTSEGEAFDQAAYARFVEAAADRLPDDSTLAILAADARMQVSQKMEPGSPSQKRLESVLAREPDHGGAIHFYIHLTDWIDRQHLAVPYAERLGRIAPAASHLVHMPSHSYYGVGRYEDAAAVNVAAIAADRAFVRDARPTSSTYRWNLLAHNMHFAINSALARGDGATALDVARQFRTEYLNGEPDPWIRLMGSSVHYSAGLHGDPAETLAAPEPEDAVDKVFHHYARGEALARLGDGAAVAKEAQAIARVRTGVRAPSLGAQGDALAEIVQRVLEGRSAMLAGDHRRAASAYRRAMRRQRAADFGNDPPLFWYSVRRSLAAALLAGGDPAGARRQLLASLRLWPNDPLALYALSLAERRTGDAASADLNLARAQAVWAGDATEVPLSRI
jgi:tetratricopeptide (TPR) repeat protein